MTQTPSPAPTVPVLAPGEPGFVLHGERTPVAALLRETWAARGLLVQLTRKEFFVRYRRATFGVLWAVALPAIQAIVLATVLSRFVRFDTEGNYALFVYSGTLGWAFFSGAASGGATSITDNSAMSAKIYFPRMVFPLTAVGAGIYGFAVSAAILVALCLVVGDGLDASVVLLLPGLGLLVVLSASVATLLGGLQVYFRDMKYLVQAVLLPLFYLTPIFYPLDAVPGLRPFLEVNPITGIVELLRAATVGADPGWLDTLWWTGGWTLVALVGAVLFHARYDRVMSDLL